MNENIEKGQEGKKVAEVTVGSVTIEIFQSRNSAKVLKKPAQGASPASPREFEIKYYDSFLVPYYEGSLRKVPRRSTLEKAQKLAKETATRLNKDGARAEFLSERDRRIYFLARVSAAKLGLDVDTACRKLVELQERLKKGTLEQAVDFHNDHGQRVQHGVFNTEIYKQYLEHLEKRGAGEYYLRDVKRYVGGFVAEYPGAISPIQTSDIDDYLGSLDTKQQEIHRFEPQCPPP